MQKWQYAEVITQFAAETGASGAKSNADVVIYRYDEKHEEKQGPLGKVLGYMGDNGWELVAVRSTSIAPIGHKVSYLFKRPKTE
jgi:hypothetical protein